MHYNHNSDRAAQTTSEGEPIITVRFPKFKKGEISIHAKKAPTTYGNILILQLKINFVKVLFHCMMALHKMEHME